MAISSENIDTILRHVVGAMSPDARQRLDEDLGGSLDALVGDPGLAQDAARFLRACTSDTARATFRSKSPKQQRMALDQAGYRPSRGSDEGFAARFPEASRIRFAR